MNDNQAIRQEECSVRVNPYLNFNGQCAEAFKLYEQVLGGKAVIMRFGESPMAAQVPPEQRNYVLHARLEVGDTVLMASDAPPDRFEGVKGTYVNLSLDDP